MRAAFIQSVERPNRNKNVKRGWILFLLELWRLSSPALGHWSSCFSGFQTPGLNASVLLVLKALARISGHRDILLNSLALQLADGRVWHISVPIIMWANSHNKLSLTDLNSWRRVWQLTPVFLPENPMERPDRLHSIGSPSRTWLKWLSTRT